MQIGAGNLSVHRLEGGAAHEIERVTDRGDHGQDARLSRDGFDFAPVRIPGAKGKHEDAVARGFFAGLGRSASHIHSVPRNGACSERQRDRKRIPRDNHKFPAIKVELKNLAVVDLRIAAADAKKSAIRDCGDTVSQRSWKAANKLPGTAGAFQGVNPIVPDLRVTFPGHFLRKIRSTRHQQSPVADTGERRCDPPRVRKRLQL